MKDIVGIDVSVGDVVVINRPGYTKLVISEVIKITPKGIKVRYKNYKEKETFVLEGDFVIVKNV